jgi:IclR family transcriptional regulator, acetate operon repressor
MLNVPREINFDDPAHLVRGSAIPPRRPRPAVPYDYNVKSAARALEVIELFAVHRRALSVTEIANALSIPQSSSSVLLLALSSVGFVTRDRQTRKYLPSIRSVFLGNWIHDALFPNGSLLAELDALSDAARVNVRLGVRNGVQLRYVHVSWPSDESDRGRLGPGAATPICHDALGRALLADEAEGEARGIVRRANAEVESAHVVHVETFIEALREHNVRGYAECDAFGTTHERVLAMRLCAPFVGPAAIGIGVDAARLPAERADLLAMLSRVVKRMRDTADSCAN